MMINLSKKPPDWPQLVRRKAQEIKGELLEMALGYFISSEIVNQTIERMHVVFVSGFVQTMQGNNNIIGILRVLLPLLLLAAGHFLRKLAHRVCRKGASLLRRMRAGLHTYGRQKAQLASAEKARKE